MAYIDSPYTKEEMLDAFPIEYETVHAFFRDIPVDLFFAAPPEVWTPADNLVHLIKSCSPMIKALQLPKLVIKARFGLAKHPSRTFTEIRTVYMNVLLTGTLVAPAAYQPQFEEQTAAEKQKILSKWQEKGSMLTSTLVAWSEADLDKYILPHPVLGDLTIREMLFFTLYHNLHHVNDVQRLLNQVESEWFQSVPYKQ
jgi:hypothetical protein